MATLVWIKNVPHKSNVLVLQKRKTPVKQWCKITQKEKGLHLLGQNYTYVHTTVPIQEDFEKTMINRRERSTEHLRQRKVQWKSSWESQGRYSKAAACLLFPLNFFQDSLGIWLITGIKTKPGGSSLTLFLDGWNSFSKLLLWGSMLLHFCSVPWK